MSQLVDPTAATEQRSEKIESAMRSFSEISSNLLQSYNALEARAERVEHKLAVANRTLETKVEELDEVTHNLEAILAALPIGRADLDVLRSARTQQGEVVLPNGSARVLDLRSSLVRNDQGRATGTVEIIDDRTEITALGERLHAMDKVASLGTMAGGIAHELRNPLNAVAGFAELMQMRLENNPTEDPKICRWAKLIGRGAAEANAIITSLLTLSTPEGLDRSGIRSVELLKEAVHAAVTPEQAQPDVQYFTEIESFTGDYIKLRQALRNLIANAMDVAPGSPLRIKATQTDEGELALEVHDAGPGIPAEMRRRVLDPFFTTRAEGTGLGLALASTIAGLHGGHLEIQNSPSDLGGALVAIHLPLLTARS